MLASTVGVLPRQLTAGEHFEVTTGEPSVTAYDVADRVEPRLIESGRIKRVVWRLLLVPKGPTTGPMSQAEIDWTNSCWPNAAR